MLSAKEARALAEICGEWPCGLGCILIPSEKSKRGWKAAYWGFQGRIPMNFKYSDIPQIQEAHEKILLCPVTYIGIQRQAENYSDHLSAYREIIAALKVVIQDVDSSEFRKLYNMLLSKQPKVLQQYFLKYAEMIEREKKHA